MKREILRLVQRGSVKSALEKLIEVIPEDWTEYNDVISLLGRYNGNEKDRHMKTAEQYNIQANMITSAVIHLVNSINWDEGQNSQNQNQSIHEMRATDELRGKLEQLNNRISNPFLPIKDKFTYTSLVSDIEDYLDKKSGPNGKYFDTSGSIRESLLRKINNTLSSEKHELLRNEEVVATKIYNILHEIREMDRASDHMGELFYKAINLMIGFRPIMEDFKLKRRVLIVKSRLEDLSSDADALELLWKDFLLELGEVYTEATSA